MMRKLLRLLIFGVSVGAMLALIALLKQKNRALEEAQLRIASIEQRMQEIMASVSRESQESDLRTQLAQQRAELERLRMELATLQTQKVASGAGPFPEWNTLSSLEASMQTQANEPRADAEKTSEHLAQGAALSHRQGEAGAMGAPLSAFPAAKRRFVERALEANLAPTLIERPQTLSAIDGIGPVFEQRLYDAGIGSYWEVAMLDDETLRRILKLSKARAALVRFDAIRASAQRLAEETQTRGCIWSSEPVDDFEKIPGVGQVYKRRLYDAGVRTYAALASITPQQLEEICASRAPVPPDYAGWIEAAQRLAEQKARNETKNDETKN
ncbi:MAG: helix-hairpin-helix domain-containing protein [Caldilinea sp.]|nr:helix-hairpin-helix domain-containing protein [Caldilinea sp.]MDW8438831.1 helix-hairpin-helix domain-containing protein [Caldilineaceae bacterium]